VSRVLDLSFRDAERWLEGHQVVPSVANLRQKLRGIRTTEDASPMDTHNYWTDSMLRPFYSGKMTKYIFDRGFSKEILKKWEVGYDRSTQDIIFPARDEHGILLGIIRRSTTGGIKYTNSLGLQRKDFLYGLDKTIISTGLKKRVFVVEGPLDTIWMAQAGLPAVGLLGANLADNQAKLLVKHFDIAIFTLDNDKAGQEGLLQAKKKLSDKMVVLKGVVLEGRKDVQEMTLEEVSNIRTEWVRGNIGSYDRD
jgi:DNA primase